MKSTVNIQIARVANGIVITASEDSTSQKQLVAKDEPEARALVTNFLEETVVPDTDAVKTKK